MEQSQLPQMGHELSTTLLSIATQLRELDTPGCTKPKNRTMRTLAKTLGAKAKSQQVREIMYFISSDQFFAYNKAKEVMATMQGLLDGTIDVTFKDANGMLISNPNCKEKVDE